MVEVKQRKDGQKQNYVLTKRYALTTRELAAKKRLDGITK